MAVPYTFANASAAIPLSELDANFATPIQIGATNVSLGGFYPTIDGLTLSNVTIYSSTLPVNVSQGGTGLSSPGAAGNVLTSTGTAWISSGLSNYIRNISSTSSTSAYSNATASPTDMLTITVTPASVSSKFLIMASASLVCEGGANNGAEILIVKNSTTIFNEFSGHALNNSFASTFSPIIVDAPATTSSITYHLQAVPKGSATIYSGVVSIPDPAFDGTYNYSLVVIEF